MPTTPSRQQALLTGVAGFVSGDIASARINGTVSVPDIEKTVDGSVLTVTYTVTQAQAETITQVELLAADGTVLTSASVYIPVLSVETVQHRITLEEGVNHGSN